MAGNTGVQHIAGNAAVKRNFRSSPVVYNELVQGPFPGYTHNGAATNVPAGMLAAGAS